MGQTTEVYRNRFGSLLAGRGKSTPGFLLHLVVGPREGLELLDMLKRGRSAALAEGRVRM
jgi:hypothetical protein